MFIDTHCHLEMEPLSSDIVGVIKGAQSVGVEKMITIGTDVETSKKAIEIARKYPGIYSTVGAHPELAKEISLSYYQQLLSLARNPEVVAIGEVGLDYFRLDKSSQYINSATEGEQKCLFEQMIDIAIENELPLIVHSRDSAKDTLEIINQYKNNLEGGVFHCFSYNFELSRQFLDTGFYLSFTNIIGYSKNEELRQVVKYTPIERILIETDAPFLPPEVRRGGKSEPSDVVVVAEKIAEVKKLEVNQVAEITTKNTQDLFNI